VATLAQAVSLFMNVEKWYYSVTREVVCNVIFEFGICIKLAGLIEVY
jgi:hypothetical protein